MAGLLAAAQRGAAAGSDPRRACRWDRTFIKTLHTLRSLPPALPPAHPRMHIADITMFHAPHSGGVRRYLEAKRRWAARRFEHTLVVPGATALQGPGLRCLAAPPIPLGGGYRFPLRSGPWQRCLEQLAPDLIEAGSAGLIRILAS